jgi:hypothetical protein
MSDRNGVEIDYCPECRGVWLDRGELDKIIERSGQYAQEHPQKDYRDDKKDYRDDRKDYRDKRESEHPHKKKRGGFLGDLFDF